MINGQKYEVSVKYNSFYDIEVIFTPLGKDEKPMPNVSPQVF